MIHLINRFDQCNDIMTDCPIRTTAGDIGCPKCSTPLEINKAPFLLHNEYVGHFESLVCPICNYSALTETGYDQAIDEAKKFGMIGPAHNENEVLQETDDFVEEHYVTFDVYASGNFVDYEIEKLLDNPPMDAFNSSSLLAAPQIRTRRTQKSSIIK
jgi:hypothetical protein